MAETPAMPSAGRTRLLVAGPFPPPVTGMAVAVEGLANLIANDVEVVRLDDSVGRSERTVGYHLRRVLRLVGLTTSLVRHRPRAKSLYVACNAGFGMWYTTALLTVARLLRYRSYLHHHAYSYINRPTLRFRVLLRLCGPLCLHLVYCRCMGEDFGRHYRRFGEYAELSIAYCLPEPEDDGLLRRPTAGPLRAGHLSNLCEAKGLGRVSETMRLAAPAGVANRLVLAGPVMTESEQPLLDRLLTTLGTAVDYRGSVSGDRKRAFFEDIDVFLFPSLYDNESFALVVWEAMSRGKPVIAYEAGCLNAEAVGAGGVVLQRGDDFADAALGVLRRWSEDSHAYESASEAAREAATRLRSLALRQILMLEERVSRTG